MTIETAIAGAAIGAVGTFMSGQQQTSNYQAEAAANRYRAQVSKNNAIIAEQNAEFKQMDADRAVARGNTLGYRQDLQTRAVLGEQVAAQGASGFDVGSASSVAVRDSTHMLGREDTLTIRENSSVEAFNAMIGKYNAEAQAVNFEAEAGLYTSAAKTADANASASELSTYINTASSLLGSSSSIAQKYDPSKFGSFTLGAGA